MIGSPLENTIEAASGSTKILNYAAGDQFPSPIAPPIIVTPRMRECKSGKALNKIARFVIAPVTTNSTGSFCEIISEYMWRKGF